MIYSVKCQIIRKFLFAKLKVSALLDKFDISNEMSHNAPHYVDRENQRKFDLKVSIE